MADTDTDTVVVESWGSPGVWQNYREDNGRAMEIHLAEIDGVDVEVEATEQRTTVATGGTGFTVPSRRRARVWVDDGLREDLGMDAIITTVRRLLGFAPDTPFYGLVGQGCREARSAHRRGWGITVRRERPAGLRPARAKVYDDRNRREGRVKT